MAKLYPFSVMKHQHDIELYYGRLWLTIREIEDGEIEASADALERLYEYMDNKVEPLRNKMYSAMPVVMLSGPEIGLAKKMVEWARNKRAASLYEHGMTEYLIYV